MIMLIRPGTWTIWRLKALFGIGRAPPSYAAHARTSSSEGLAYGIMEETTSASLGISKSLRHWDAHYAGGYCAAHSILKPRKGLDTVSKRRHESRMNYEVLNSTFGKPSSKSSVPKGFASPNMRHQNSTSPPTVVSISLIIVKLVLTENIR
jgi:hypothetical protein